MCTKGSNHCCGRIWALLVALFLVFSGSLERAEAQQRWKGITIHEEAERWPLIFDAPLVQQGNVTLSGGVALPFRAYYAWEEGGANNILTTHPRIVERIASMARRSELVRTRLESLKKSGIEVWLLTPDEIQYLDEEHLFYNVLRGGGLAWVRLREGSREGRPPRVERAYILIDLQGVLRQAEFRGQAEWLLNEDLELLIGHELIVHVGSVAKSRSMEDYCHDAQGDEMMGCSVVEENLLAFSLGLSNPMRTSYQEGMRVLHSGPDDEKSRLDSFTRDRAFITESALEWKMEFELWRAPFPALVEELHRREMLDVVMESFERYERALEIGMPEELVREREEEILRTVIAPVYAKSEEAWLMPR